MLDVWKLRFEDNRHRHPELSWEDVERRLLLHPGAGLFGETGSESLFI